MSSNIIDLKKRKAGSASARPVLREPAPVRPAPPLSVAVSTRAPEAETTKPRPSSASVAWSTRLQRTTHSPRMLMLLVGATLVTGVLLLIQPSWLLLTLILLVIFIVFVQRRFEPPVSRIIITESGVSIDRRVRYWKEFRSYWIEYNPGALKELSLEPKIRILPDLQIPLEDTDPIKVRNILVEYLPEKERQLTIVDAFLKGK